MKYRIKRIEYPIGIIKFKAQFKSNFFGIWFSLIFGDDCIFMEDAEDQIKKDISWRSYTGDKKKIKVSIIPYP